MVTATMVLARLGPSTATTRIASTRLGTAMIRSITRVTATSIVWLRLPRNDTQASPSSTPTTKDTPMTARPMNSDTRAPWIRRDSMSRPRLSVPSRKRLLPPDSQAGAARTASRNCSFGECGATTSAKIASRTIAATTTRPATAPRFSRNATQNARSGGISPLGASVSRMTYPGVDQAVQQVHQQVHADHDRRDQHHPALQGRIVAARDRFDQPLADAGPGKDGLGQHRAGQRSADLQPDDGHHRDQCIAQRVQPDHAPGGQTLRTRGAQDRKSTRLNSSHQKISYA